MDGGKATTFHCVSKKRRAAKAVTYSGDYITDTTGTNCY